MPAGSLGINASRLNDNLDALGDDWHHDEGCTAWWRSRALRHPRRVRNYVIELMQSAGLSVRIDAAGNIIGRIEGTDPSLPAIVLGSHTDTVPAGGRYDGALGVIAAIEVVQAIKDSGRTSRHPVEVVVFTNEEGTGFHRWLLGSRAVAGLWEPEDFSAVGDDGVALASRLPDLGGNISRIDEARRRPDELACYLELHIEQGPTLHRGGFPIGVVTGITGRSVYHIDIVGEANHAGTTPMSLRRDAMSAAAQVALAVRHIAGEMEVCRVGTVGSMEVHPNAANVIPGRVVLGCEFRDERMESLAAAEVELRRTAEEVAHAEQVAITVTAQRNTPSVPISSNMQQLIADATGLAGLEHISLPSGAGHDAQAIATVTPSAMVFVPSVGGISHAPAEYTTPEDCANGAQVLLNAMALADER
ncbi:N-carbamoyl-L-amino acid hydrolase [Geodia barretti]|uniref:N-carbamoyl-L-amino acid hydrolase n=1 Tax=Geodia barretti TaxID=519541 RepID=A0AA35U2X2_GEOBA|nr:N-carbamoyl-L-amino acid hydrolase [Geodia barretti]